MIKKIYLLSLLTVLFIQAHAQQWEWARQINGAANDSGLAIDIDDDGNVFVVGRCKGFTLFEDETTPIGPITIGDRDAFISKYNKNGQLLWATLAGGVPAEYDLAQSVVADNNGGCYITGFFNNTSSFGDISLTSNGGRDVFVAHLDDLGTFTWAHGFGGAAEDNGYGITVNSVGEVIVCGRVNGIVDVSGTTIGSTGVFNGYLGKYAADGTFIEIHCLQSAFRSVARKITVDPNDNIYVCGGLNGSCTYEGTPFATENSAAWEDMILLKCDADFNPLWFQSGGGNYFDTGLDINATATSAYLVGTYGATATFDTITRTFNSAAAGGAAVVNAASDFFIASYDSETGNIKWLLDGGGEGKDEIQGVSVTENEHIYFTGFFRDSVAFGDTLLYSGGLNSYNMITGRLDSLGNVIWARETGNTAVNRSFKVVTDAYENLYISGDFYNEISFDGITKTPANRDAFGAKMTQRPAPEYELSGTSFCLGDTITLSLSGISSPLTYTYSATDAYTSWTDSTHIYYIAESAPTMNLAGTLFAENNVYTDSIIISDEITVSLPPMISLPTDTSSCSYPLLLEVEAGFDSYNWNDGLSLSNALSVETSGTYYVAVTNLEGCTTTDSIEVVIDTDISLELPDTVVCESFVYTASDEFASYDWNDGLDTDNEINIGASGTYYLEVSNAIGCTAVDTMYVEISMPIPTLPEDTIFCLPGTFYLTTDDFYESYTWSTGETGTNEIEITVSDTFSVVVIDEHGCEGTNSTIVKLTYCSGIFENEPELPVLFLYNSTTKTIKNISDQEIRKIKLTSLEGKTVLEINNLNSEETYSLEHLPPSLYLLYVEGQQTVPIKILIAQ